MDNREQLRKEILCEADMLEGCKNRMCVTYDEDELVLLYTNLSLHASDLFRLNLKRIRIKEN